MKDEREKDVIIIDFTVELLDAWLKIYFKEHSRARKIPIESPAHPSLNKWIILQRITMNKLKQDWKDFGAFCVKHYGLEMLGISKCKCRYTVFNSTKTRVDLDNITPKMLLDSLTAECTGVICDDGFSCITELTLCAEYRKGEKGARLEFYDCEYDKELLAETREKEMTKSSKRKATIEANKAKKKTTKSKTKK